MKDGRYFGVVFSFADVRVSLSRRKERIKVLGLELFNLLCHRNE